MTIPGKYFGRDSGNVTAIYLFKLEEHSLQEVSFGKSSPVSERSPPFGSRKLVCRTWEEEKEGRGVERRWRGSLGVVNEKKEAPKGKNWKDSHKRGSRISERCGERVVK